MAKGKSKKKDATPEPDTVMLYIENPIGIYGAKDWYKNTEALGIVSTWLYLLADAGGVTRPESLWYRGGVGSSFLRDIVVDLYVPGSDASKVEYALGYHYWKDFARLSPRMERDLMLPQDEESRTTIVYRSPCRSTIKLDSDQFLKIPLIDIPRNHPNFRDFTPGPYPAPTLPYVPNLKSTYKEPLPTRPLPPPSPTPQPIEFKQQPEDEDEEKKKKKAILAATVMSEGRSTPATKQEEGSLRTKEEQLEYEMNRLAQNRLTSPPPQETKPDIIPTSATKQEQLEYELSRLAQNNRLATPQPPPSQVETKPNVKEEQLLLELELLIANGGTVPPEHRRGGSTMKPDPEAERQVQAKQEPSAPADESEAVRRRVKEELIELEMARLARSSAPTPGLAASVKPEPGLSGPTPPDLRSTMESSVGPLEGTPQVVVKPEPGSSAAEVGVRPPAGNGLVAVKPEPGDSNPLKRPREGQNQPADQQLAGKRFKQEWQY